MASKEITYEPLRRPSDDLPDSVLIQHYATTAIWKRWERLFWIFCIIFCNGVWVGLYNYQQEVQVVNRYPIRVPYYFTTPFSDNNLTVANKLWEELFPLGGGTIVVDYEWATKNHIPSTNSTSSDGRAVYTVSAYHYLHCLTLLRSSLYQYKNNHKPVSSWHHIVHCIDALRQHIQCSADPTIETEGAIHECRDWDALKQWTEERAFLERSDLVVSNPPG